MSSIGASRFTRYSESHCAGSLCTNGPTIEVPALLTRMSTTGWSVATAVMASASRRSSGSAERVGERRRDSRRALAVDVGDDHVRAHRAEIPADRAPDPAGTAVTSAIFPSSVRPASMSGNVPEATRRVER